MPDSHRRSSVAAGVRSAEGTQTAPAGWAVGCSDLLCPELSEHLFENIRPLLGNLDQRRCRPARLPTVLLPILERAHRNAQKVSKPGLTQPNFLTRLNNGWQINGTNRANSPRLDILDGVECFLPD